MKEKGLKKSNTLNDIATNITNKALQHKSINKNIELPVHTAF